MLIFMYYRSWYRGGGEKNQKNKINKYIKDHKKKYKPIQSVENK